MSVEPVIVIHGGAWSVPDCLAEASRKGVKKAAEAGHEVLRQGGSALEAVTQAVKILEDDPAFDAGRGSVLTDQGEVEMDALLMDGKTLNCGAVAAVNNVKNPIELARVVLEKTPHTLIVGAGANMLADEFGVERVGPDYLVTETGRREWEVYKKYNHTVSSLFSQRDGDSHDTVGAVALDQEGNVACATSTGGITGKRGGRVGDSPLVGCGGYADSRAGAVSTTGHGESISRVCLARAVVHHLEAGLSPHTAATTSLSHMYSRVGGSGGVIVIDTEGRYSAQFSTERMPWAAIAGDVLTSGFLPGERLQENLKLLLEYGGEGYENRTMQMSKPDWLAYKTSLGFDFPNLPYYQEGDLKLTQSMAIMRHVGRKFNLVGQTELESARADMITDQLMDYKGCLTDLVYNAGFSEQLKQDWVEGKANFAARGSLHGRLTNLERFLVAGKGQWFAGKTLTFADFFAWELIDQHRLLFKGCLDGFMAEFESLPNIAKYLGSPGYKAFPIWSVRAKYSYHPVE